MSLVVAENVLKRFVTGRDLVGRATEHVDAVRGVNLTIGEGQTLALVGESGSGKSTTARVLARLIEPTSGRVMFDGEDLTAMSAGRLRSKRKQIQIVFQDPYSSLDPRMTIREIVAEPLRVQIGRRRALDDGRLGALLREVGLTPAYLSRRPAELSGGQRQRVAIARALVTEPRFIICDEVVSALDVSTQAQVLNLLRDLQRRRNVSYLFVTHDLAIVPFMASNVAVMHLGEIIESGPVDEVFARPLHPYTKALISAAPRLDPARRGSRDRIVLSGDPPNPANPPAGCAFHTRCPEAFDRCRTARPEPVSIGRVSVSCHLHTSPTGHPPTTPQRSNA